MESLHLAASVPCWFLELKVLWSLLYTAVLFFYCGSERRETFRWEASGRKAALHKRSRRRVSTASGPIRSLLASTDVRFHFWSETVCSKTPKCGRRSLLALSLSLSAEALSPQTLQAGLRGTKVALRAARAPGSNSKDLQVMPPKSKQ